MTDLKRLRELAVGLKKFGEWYEDVDGDDHDCVLSYDYQVGEDDDDLRRVLICRVNDHDVTPTEKHEIAQFIAAANPTAILALLDRLERYEGALEFYADASRWIEEDVIATGMEMASRFDEALGESVRVETQEGQKLGTRYRPSGRTRADRGKIARVALEGGGE